MKQFFIFLALLLLATCVGIFVTKNPGYALITINKFALELPLWLTVVGLIFLLFISYFLIRLICNLFRLPRVWNQWLHNKQLKKKLAEENQSLLKILLKEPRDWHDIKAHLEKFTTKDWMSKTQLQDLEHQCYINLLKETYSNVIAFNKIWQCLPYRLKKEPSFQNLYVLALTKQHETQKAEAVTRKILKKHWNEDLVNTYGLIESKNPQRQLLQAEKWLQWHSNDSVLLLSLGRICKRLQLWGKAQDYFIASNEYNPHHVETYLELGDLYEKLKEQNTALNYYKQAAQIGATFNATENTSLSQ